MNGVQCSRSWGQLADVVTQLDLNHNVSPVQHSTMSPVRLAAESDRSRHDITIKVGCCCCIFCVFLCFWWISSCLFCVMLSVPLYQCKWLPVKTRLQYVTSRTYKKAKELPQRWPRDAPYMSALKIFESPRVHPLLLFAKFLMGFCSDRSYECTYKIWSL